MDHDNIKGTGKTLEEWQEFARKDNCLNYMVPSELRSILGALARSKYETIEGIALHFDNAAQAKYDERAQKGLSIFQEQSDKLEREGNDLDDVAETIRTYGEPQL